MTVGKRGSDWYTGLTVLWGPLSLGVRYLASFSVFRLQNSFLYANKEPLCAMGASPGLHRRTSNYKMHFRLVYFLLLVPSQLGDSWITELPFECTASSGNPSLRMESLSGLLRSWPPSQTEQPGDVPVSIASCETNCSAPPLLFFDVHEDRCRAITFARAGLPFVVRRAPGSLAIAAKWTPQYLAAELLDEAQATHQREVYSFGGDTFRYGDASNYRSDLVNASKWWAEWASDVPITDAASKSEGRRSSYIQTNSAERPLLRDALSPLFGPRSSVGLQTDLSRHEPFLPPVLSENAAARLLFEPESSFTAESIAECRFGLKGTRVEVRVPAFLQPAQLHSLPVNRPTSIRTRTSFSLVSAVAALSSRHPSPASISACAECRLGCGTALLTGPPRQHGTLHPSPPPWARRWCSKRATCSTFRRFGSMPSFR